MRRETLILTGWFLIGAVVALPMLALLINPCSGLSGADLSSCEDGYWMGGFAVFGFVVIVWLGGIATLVANWWITRPSRPLDRDPYLAQRKAILRRLEATGVMPWTAEALVSRWEAEMAADGRNRDSSWWEEASRWMESRK